MKNLQYLATELFKVKNGFSREIVKYIFVFQENETYYLSLSGQGFFEQPQPGGGRIMPLPEI